jgi:hypothetical protein
MASVSWWVMLIVFLQQEIDVFKDQSLHFPHDMRGNAAIPTKAHWIKPEFAFTFRTPNVDVGRLCALVGVKVKPKSTYSEYRWHPFKVLPLGHAGKFCSGQGGDVTAIPVRQRPCATSCQPLPRLPYDAFYVTFWQDPDTHGQNRYSEPSYSGSFGPF